LASVYVSIRDLQRACLYRTVAGGGAWFFALESAAIKPRRNTNTLALTAHAHHANSGQCDSQAKITIALGKPISGVKAADPARGFDSIFRLQPRIGYWGSNQLRDLVAGLALPDYLRQALKNSPKKPRELGCNHLMRLYFSNFCPPSGTAG